MEAVSLCDGADAEGHPQHQLEICQRREIRGHDSRPSVSLQWRAAQSMYYGLDSIYAYNNGSNRPVWLKLR